MTTEISPRFEVIPILIEFKDFLDRCLFVTKLRYWLIFGPDSIPVEYS